MPELHTAAYFGDIERLKALLQTENPNARSMNGNTALMSAFFKRQKEAYMLLIQSGADPNLVDDDGLDVLTNVLTKDAEEEWLLFVLKHGVTPNPVRHRGLLVGATKNHSFKLFHAILTASPNMVDDTDEDGNTPLHLVFRRVFCFPIKKTMVSLLLRHGADVGAIDKWRMTPLDVAELYYRNSAVECPQRKLYENLLKTLVHAKNSVWLYSVARVLQARGRDAEFEAKPLALPLAKPLALSIPVAVDSKEKVNESEGVSILQRVVCYMDPSLIQELALML
jgi:hypothetical protein